MKALTHTEVDQRGRSESLVVLLHAWTLSGGSLANVRSAVEEALPNADLLVPDYPSHPFANTDLALIAEALLDAIDEAWESRQSKGSSYRDVILIGHSLGALLVRKAYVFGRGQTEDSSAELPARSRQWISQVSRIVLLAGMSRGWSLSPRARHMPWWRNIFLRLAASLLSRVPAGRLVKAARRGAPFVANLRIQWLNLAHSNAPPPPTIQLLGSVDDVVSWEDNVDIQSGASFKYLRVPNTGHLSVIDFSGRAGARRKAIFLKALVTPTEALVSDYIDEPKVDSAMNHVVFVMHGIRDRGFWREDIAFHIKDMAARAGQKAVVCVSGYGYFPMIRFLLFSERQKNVRWFMDEYTEKLARYPNAQMHFIGHSNGTYLLASALKRYAACRFARIVFAGSVVPTSFQWDSLVEKGRVQAICNYVATSDVVVGVFPGFFELIRLGDLGSAGHNGFQDEEGQRFAVTFIRGGHAAALSEATYESMIRFVLHGEAPALSPELLAEERSPRAVWLSKFSWAVWLVLVVVLFGGTWAIGTFLGPVLAAAFAVLMLLVLYTV